MWTVSKIKNHDENLLVCTLGEEKYGIDIKWINKVIYFTPVKIIHSVPDYILGLLDVQGTMVPLIHLGMYLNLPLETSYTINTPIILCKSVNKQMAFLVKKVSGIELYISQKKTLEGNNVKDEINDLSELVTTTSGRVLVVNMERIFYSIGLSIPSWI